MILTLIEIDKRHDRQIKKAVKYFHPSSREQYRKVFQELSNTGEK